MSLETIKATSHGLRGELSIELVENLRPMCPRMSSPYLSSTVSINSMIVISRT